MGNKFKVAVCWSGQMRTHNKELLIYDDVINGRVVKTNAVYNPDSTVDIFANNSTTEKTNIFKVIDDLRHYDFEVDHYGHTWADCELPVNKHKFKSLIHEDQIVIDEWVDEDPENRQPGDVEKYDARECYGQVWSGFRAYGLVEGDYHAVIKIRWDILCYSTKELSTWIRHLIFDQGETNRDRTLGEKLTEPTEYYRTPVGWTSKKNFSEIDINLINDIFWISNAEAFKLWKEIDFKKKLHSVYAKSKISNGDLISTLGGVTLKGHKLWNLMQPSGISCFGYLPENFCEYKR